MAFKKVGLAIATLAATALLANCAGTGTGSFGTCGTSCGKPAPSCKGMSSCKGQGGSGSNGCDSK